MQWTQSKHGGRGNPYWHYRGRNFFYTIKRVAGGFKWQVQDRSGGKVGSGVKKTLSQAKQAAKASAKKAA